MRIVRYAVAFGFALGAAGFLAGFVGPIVFMPESNQGPLLGIFITGPLGFLVGTVIGAIVSVMRAPKPPIVKGGPSDESWAG